eukprot:7541968-Alexandrium_andersonii.AAC.1
MVRRAQPILSDPHRRLVACPTVSRASQPRRRLAVAVVVAIVAAAARAVVAAVVGEVRHRPR